MPLSDDARVTIILADYLGIDAGGKLNALGAGFSLTGLQPNGMTAPQHIGVLVDLPARYAGQDCTVSVELRDVALASAVKLPGPSGESEAMRLQQIMKVDPMQLPGVYLPSDLPTRLQMVVAFQNGLPLALGRSYQWRVEIDGRHRKGWVTQFHVVGPPPGPVYGGPSEPADIPDLVLDDPID